MLDAIIEPFQNYYKELPDNTWTCVGRSAMFSFVASVVLARGNMPKIFQSSFEEFRYPLFAATCAAVASLIHGLMTPLFNRLFGDDDQNQYHREFIKMVIDISLLKFALLASSGYVEELALRVKMISLNWIKASVALSCDIFDFVQVPTQTVRQWFLRYGCISEPNSSSTYFVTCY